MSHDDMITIHANILQVTDAAVLVNCDDREIWLPLSQIDFAGEKGDTDVPISLPEWLAAEGCTLRPDEPESQAPVTEDKEDVDAAPLPAKACFLKTESITVSVPLDPEERESVGDRMASALEKIAELEDDLDSYRKSINAQIKSLQKDAEAARKEWQEGKTEQEVYCDVMADYGQEAIIWLDHDNGAEMKRRPMTAEERQYRLPIPRPGDAASTPPAEPADEQSAPVFAINRHTCLDCGHMNDGENDTQAEECAS